MLMYARLVGVAPYAGGMNRTWWDRDLGIGGRVLVKDLTTHHVKTHLLNLNRPSMCILLIRVV